MQQDPRLWIPVHSGKNTLRRNESTALVEFNSWFLLYLPLPSTSSMWLLVGHRPGLPALVPPIPFGARSQGRTPALGGTMLISKAFSSFSGFFSTPGIYKPCKPTFCFLGRGSHHVTHSSSVPVKCSCGSQYVLCAGQAGWLRSPPLLDTQPLHRTVNTWGWAVAPKTAAAGVKWIGVLDLHRVWTG